MTHRVLIKFRDAIGKVNDDDLYACDAELPSAVGDEIVIEVGDHSGLHRIEERNLAFGDPVGMQYERLVVSKIPPRGAGLTTVLSANIPGL
jgi:hypothetical protein